MYYKEISTWLLGKLFLTTDCHLHDIMSATLGDINAPKFKILSYPITSSVITSHRNTSMTHRYHRLLPWI